DIGGLKSSDPEKALRSGIALYRKLAAEQPEDPALQQELAVRYSELFQLLSVAGRAEEADRIFAEGLDVWRKRANDHAATPDQAIQFRKLAELLFTQQRPDEAERVYRKALELLRMRAAGFPAIASGREEVGHWCRELAARLPSPAKDQERVELLR